MSWDTTLEDYEVFCEEQVRDAIEGSVGIKEVWFEQSQAEQVDEDGQWYWAAKLTIRTTLQDRIYRIPVYCDNEEGAFGFGDLFEDLGDTPADLWYLVWVEEINRVFN